MNKLRHYILITNDIYLAITQLVLFYSQRLLFGILLYCRVYSLSTVICTLRVRPKPLFFRATMNEFIRAGHGIISRFAKIRARAPLEVRGI